MTVYTTMESPLGELLLAGDPSPAGVALTCVSIAEQRNAPAVQAGWRREPEAFTEVVRQLTEYFAGQRTVFTLGLAPPVPRSSSGYGAPLTRSGTARRSPTASSPRGSAYRGTGSRRSAPQSAPTRC